MTASPASRQIDRRIRALGDWRGDVLARVRALVLASSASVVEEWKWEVPVWSYRGIICTGETYAKVVKVTFAHGAGLPDPAGLFNASLTGNTRRAIDIREGEVLHARAFKALVRAAIAHNRATAGPEKSRSAKKRKVPTRTPSKATEPAGTVRLLSGGNPQIAKGDGDGPVRTYIAAMPDWKRAIGERLDALITRSVPRVQKAVRWNSPFYGVEGRGWFLAFHVFNRYVKVTFFKGQALTPLPPVPSKDPDARYVHLTPDEFDEAQLRRWVTQAAALPGWMP